MYYSAIKGFNQLSVLARFLFKTTYRKHQKSLGEQEKENWTPTRIIEQKVCLKVFFKNGEYLFYYADYTWG